MFSGTFTNAPHVPRVQALLDSRALFRNPVAVFEKYRAQLGPTFSLHLGGTKRSIVSTDPEFIQHVLRTNRDNYQKSDIQVERMAEFQGIGLVNSHGETWLRQRRLLAKGFQPGHLAELLPIQVDLLQEMMVRFDRDAQRGLVDVYQLMVHFTLRLVGKSLFGRSMSEQELEQIAEAISTLQAFVVRQIVQPYLIPWFRISGQSEKYQELRREADQIVLRHIRSRCQEGRGKDFLHLLLETPYQDTGEPMGEAQALIESLQLMVAGNESSSNALTWTFYLLAQHPQTVAMIRDEAARVIGNDPIHFKNLHELQFTLRVIEEALRLYPPFWMVDRVALQADEVCGIAVPAGTLVLPYIYGTHRNSAVWQNVHAFDPSRFEPEQRKARHPFGYIPFGGGPRICIGTNLAIMQMLLVLVWLVRDYDFELAGKQPIGIRPLMLLRPDAAVMMRFRRVPRA